MRTRAPRAQQQPQPVVMKAGELGWCHLHMLFRVPGIYDRWAEIDHITPTSLKVGVWYFETDNQDGLDLDLDTVVELLPNPESFIAA